MGAGYKKYEGRPTWLPDIDPAKETPWLDGTLPGDRGFDPLGLAKPQEFLQMELESLDQNKAINAPGAIKGQLATKADVVSTNSLSPYSEVFGLARFRECELMHGRWCMLATLGIVVSEGLTGVSWIDAGKVELAGAQYFNQGLPFDVGTVSWIEFTAMLGVEYYQHRARHREAPVPGRGLRPPRLCRLRAGRPPEGGGDQARPLRRGLHVRDGHPGPALQHRGAGEPDQVRQPLLRKHWRREQNRGCEPLRAVGIVGNFWGFIQLAERRQ